MENKKSQKKTVFKKLTPLQMEALEAILDSAEDHVGHSGSSQYRRYCQIVRRFARKGPLYSKKGA